MNYRLSDFAAEELRAATLYYARQSRSLAVGFVEEAARSVTLLLVNPYLGESVGKKYRRLLLRRFPYFLIYQVDAKSQLISVISVAHHSRRPDYWRNRVREGPALYALAA